MRTHVRHVGELLRSAVERSRAGGTPLEDDPFVPVP
jgi:hypothetical protein